SIEEGADSAKKATTISTATLVSQTAEVPPHSSTHHHWRQNCRHVLRRHGSFGAVALGLCRKQQRLVAIHSDVHGRWSWLYEPLCQDLPLVRPRPGKIGRAHV